MPNSRRIDLKAVIPELARLLVDLSEKPDGPVRRLMEKRLREMFDEIAEDFASFDGIPRDAAQARTRTLLGEAVAVERRRRTERLTAEKAARREAALAGLPFAAVRQRPVGHGGFHSGCLGGRRPLFRWVYDCGAWRKADREAMIREIDDYGSRFDATAGDGIDLLFLSHYDADHVNGIDRLIARVPRVTTLVVPHLSREETFAILVREGRRGSTSRSLVRLVLEPRAWMSERGISHLIRVHPPGDAPSPREESAPPPTEPVEPPEDRATALLVDGETVTPLVPSRPRGRTWFHDVGNAAQLGVWLGAARSAGWVFRTHCVTIGAEAREKLSTAMRLVFASAGFGDTDRDGGFGAAMAAMLSSDVGRATLKRIHRDTTGLSANRSSLSVFAGPEIEGAWFGPKRSRRCGWLLTGDAELGLGALRADWKSRFATDFSSVAAFMVPHHGSCHNFHTELLASAEGALPFVNAGSTSDGRWPHREVRDQFATTGHTLVTVDEDPTSGLFTHAVSIDGANAGLAVDPTSLGTWT